MYSTEKLLSENKDKIDADTTSKVEKAVADVKAAREAGVLKDLRDKLQALQQESMKIGQVRWWLWKSRVQELCGIELMCVCVCVCAVA